MTEAQLANAIRDLAAIVEDGRIGEFWCDYRGECIDRSGSTAPTGQHRDDLLRMMQRDQTGLARRVALEAAALLNQPFDRCEAIAREVVLRDPWSEIALELIDRYRGRQQPAVAGKIGQQSNARRRVV